MKKKNGERKGAGHYTAELSGKMEQVQERKVEDLRLDP